MTARLALSRASFPRHAVVSRSPSTHGAPPFSTTFSRLSSSFADGPRGRTQTGSSPESAAAQSRLPYLDLVHASFPHFEPWLRCPQELLRDSRQLPASIRRCCANGLILSDVGATSFACSKLPS
jgi:hypothetical protein